MSEPDFKIYDEDEKDLLEISKNIDMLNKELLELKGIINSINTLTIDYSPDIRELEIELDTIKNEVIKAEKYLKNSEEHQYSVRKYTAFISGGLGSLAGGTVGVLLIPIIGPTTPLITSLVGGLTGVIYSLTYE
jgi:hypothetical protein